MSVSRWLSRREKHRHHSPLQDKKVPTSSTSSPHADHFGGIFTIEDDSKSKPDKEEEKRIKGIIDRLRAFGIETIVEANARYALRIKNGDVEEAFRLLMLLQETYEGIVKPYDPSKQLLGAQNRDSVTCYLDALLFAMFSRLDSFEAMLYDSFDDMPRKRLAGLLRLWVNMLRTGRLITTDLTRCLQEAMAECGWEDASMVRQQDPSEAFTLITGQLELPLLTLKMDLYHTGKEEPQDDHKFVNERLLEVAIPDEPPEGNSVLTLEDCLEHYFNNRIEVKRHLENQRRNTLKSANPDPADSDTRTEKVSGIHVEMAEVAPSVTGTPMTQTPVAETFACSAQIKDPMERIRPGLSRKRGDSIFSQRKVELIGVDSEKQVVAADAPLERERKLSTKTEVLMPAWQFFKLLPWYTDHMPTSDAQVAAHFARKRPVLGICLKRYSFTNNGQARKRDTFIDIPLEIAVPNFVSDEQMNDEGPLVGNFRLILQSVVCHRGLSTHSGHYICLSRGIASNAVPESQRESRRNSSADSDESDDPWMRFDDLANPRITYVDIRRALKHETPYLLFYQVQPIGDDGHSIHDLPSYAEATSRSASDILTPEEKAYTHSALGSENVLEQMPSQAFSEGQRVNSSEVTDWATPSGRSSLDAGVILDGPRGRSSMQDERRRSIADTDGSFAGSTSGGSIGTDPYGSVPSTPAAEELPVERNSFLAVANKLSGSRRGSRFSKGSTTTKSRPNSTGLDVSNGSRFSLNLAKLTQKTSKTDSAYGNSEENGTAISAEPPADDSKPAVQEVSTARNSIELPPPIDSCEAVETLRPRSNETSHSKSEMTPLTKKEKAAVKAAVKKGKKSGQEDRDCSMM